MNAGTGMCLRCFFRRESSSRQSLPNLQWGRNCAKKLCQFFLQRKDYFDEVEKKELYSASYEEASENWKSKRALEKKNADELARMRNGENFQYNSTTIETLNKLINQSQKRRYELLSQLGTLKGMAYARNSYPPQIEDAEYSETAVD